MKKILYFSLLLILSANIQATSVKNPGNPPEDITEQDWVEALNPSQEIKLDEFKNFLANYNSTEEINPIKQSYIQELEKKIKTNKYSLELFEYVKARNTSPMSLMINLPTLIITLLLKEFLDEPYRQVDRIPVKSLSLIKFLPLLISYYIIHTKLRTPDLELTKKFEEKIIEFDCKLKLDEKLLNLLSETTNSENRTFLILALNSIEHGDLLKLNLLLENNKTINPETKTALLETCKLAKDLASNKLSIDMNKLQNFFETPVANEYFKSGIKNLSFATLTSISYAAFSALAIKVSRPNQRQRPMQSGLIVSLPILILVAYDLSMSMICKVLTPIFFWSISNKTTLENKIANLKRQENSLDEIEKRIQNFTTTN